MSTTQAARAALGARQEDKERLLRRSVIFRDIAPDLLRRVAEVSQIRPLRKGAVLFHQGDEGDALFGVMEGVVRIYISGRGGRQLILAFMEPGDIFGEIALLDGLPRTASADAAEDTRLLVIERTQFRALLEQEPRLSLHIIELLCERLRSNTDRLGEYAFLDLRSRLAKKLHELAMAYGEQQEDGVRIALHLSQTDLAQTLGVTRESINKQIKAWTREKVLLHKSGHVVVTDMERLKAHFAFADEDTPGSER
ncbi:MAG: Crp/Fnr family transcriptional regulator [Alphaproteobacteria bacterium]|nr:Crp/Fnr family transcriptional regulator [Alphaproteobacteria bacterium]